MTNVKKIIQHLDENCIKWLEAADLLDEIKQQFFEFGEAGGMPSQFTPAMAEVFRRLTTPPPTSQHDDSKNK